MQNLVHAFNACDDRVKPIVKVICDSRSDFEELKYITQYPYLEYRPIGKEPWYQNIIRRLIKKILKKEKLNPNKIPYLWERLDAVYPVNSLDEFRRKDLAIGWIPDFQEKYLPEFFSEEEIQNRFDWQCRFVKNRVPVVFSSENAHQDFFQFIPNAVSIKSFVLPFAVTHLDYSKESIAVLRLKFGISERYLFCANQFWTHKNHLFLFESYLKAKERGLNAQLVCSGKLSDYRDNEYSNKIRSFIVDNHLENDILLLGFIDRTEQLCLMKNSYAIVQPSLFEGWSTVVEDAKCLNKFIFLSDLCVHREQNPANVCYFDPHNEEDLVEKLLTIVPCEGKKDYSENVKAFGESFLAIIQSLGGSMG